MTFRATAWVAKRNPKPDKSKIVSVLSMTLPAAREQAGNRFRTWPGVLIFLGEEF